MTIEDLGNIGEFVGAIGVIASLVYLAVQIRRSDESTRAATVQSLLGRSTEITLQLVYSGFDPEKATELQRTQLLFGLFNHFNNAFYQKSVGMLDEETWMMFEVRIRGIIDGTDEFEDWWQQVNGSFSRSFVDHVNQMRHT